MPLVSSRRAADTASIPFDQDFQAPPRAVRSHAFVGVDYPLSLSQNEDPQRAIRHALLKGAASLRIESATVDEDRLAVTVTVTNSGAGHDLPTGFAFMRQMWIELVVDAEGARIFESGTLAAPDRDLCDAGTLEDPGMAPLVVGCTGPDESLVNFQKKLVDRTEVLQGPGGVRVPNDQGDGFVAVAAQGSRETAVQRLFGNPTSRKRPVDGQVLSAIAPRETRAFVYRLPVAGQERVTVSARLLFRHLPPYAIRALARATTDPKAPRLEPMIANLDVVEMASATAKVTN
jgi:hypothetical protein